jgi:cell division protein FtsN
MTQDFAKIRPEPLLERKAVQAPPSWSLLMSGIAIGVVVGVFGCVLLYLSGSVPPLASAPASVAAVTEPGTTVTREAIPATPTPAAEPALTMDFYTELANYTVEVGDERVELTEQQRLALAPPEQQFDNGYLLQSGAFQQRSLADSEVARQREMGVDVFITQESLPGRTLYLVQSGPYMNSTTLAAAERALRSNNLSSLRLRVQ